MDGNDSLPQTICQPCINRIQSFDKFCNEVSHNQELLRSSKLKNQNDSTSLIQLSSQNIPFTNETGTFIITVANTNDIIELTKKPNEKNFIEIVNKEQIICHKTQSIKSNAIDIEQEFDNLASKDIVAELRVESENEIGYNEDEDDDGVEDLSSSYVVSTHAQYKNFPTKILDGCKLLYKGYDLLNMISRFYRLECDQCE